MEIEHQLFLGDVFDRVLHDERVVELVVEGDLERPGRLPVHDRQAGRLRRGCRKPRWSRPCAKAAGLAREIELRDARELARGRDLHLRDVEGRAGVERDAHVRPARRTCPTPTRRRGVGREGRGELAVLAGLRLVGAALQAAFRNGARVLLELHLPVLDLAVDAPGELDVVRRAVAPGPEHALLDLDPHRFPRLGCAAVRKARKGRSARGRSGKAVSVIRLIRTSGTRS